MGKLALAQVFDRVLRFSPVNITPPMIHNYLHLHVVLTRSTNGRKLRTFSEIGEHWIENHFHFLLIFKGFKVASYKFVQPSHNSPLDGSFIRLLT